MHGNERHQPGSLRWRPAGRVAQVLASSALACAVMGCGGGSPPPPNPDGSVVDSGFRDLGVRDTGMDMGDGADADVTADLGPDADVTADLGIDDSGTQTDNGMGTDSGPQVGEVPVIANIAWTVAGDGSCAAGSGIRFSVVVSDSDTIAFFLTPTVTGMGSCFLSDVDTATDMVDIVMTNCPHDQNYTPTVTLRDPEGNAASVSGFTIMPCTNGAYFP